MERFLIKTKRADANSAANEDSDDLECEDQGELNESSVFESEPSTSRGEGNDIKSQDAPSTSTKVVKNSSKRERETNRQKFRHAWLQKFDWCSVVDEKLFCKYCKKSLTNNVVNLHRHDKCEQHAQIVKSLKKQVFFNQEKLEETSIHTNQIKTAELLIIMFLIEHNLPFLIIEPLISLMKKIASDSSIIKHLKCGKTKATETVTSVIKEEYLRELSEILKRQTFSIIVDESTDISTKKSLAIVVRYYDYVKCKVKDRFLSLVELSNSSANDIHEAISSLFNKLAIPIKNLIGYAADNASVMMGSKSGLKALFLKSVPNLYVMPCTCHTIHLCSAAAGKELPSSVEKLVRNIYLYFSHSTKRQKEFEKFQEYFHVKNHKILKTSFTRWLALESVVNRVLEQWVPLKHYFIVSEFESDSDLAANIYSDLNEETQIYLLFLSYILKISNEINIEFQAEKPRIHMLMDMIKSFLKNILSNFIKRDFLTDFCNLNFLNDKFYVDLSNVYIGARAELLIKSENIPSAKINEIKSNCLNYYKILCSAITKRFDLKDKVLLEVTTINPTKLGENLIELISLFPNLIRDVNIEELDSEWRALLNLTNVSISTDLELERFWSEVFLLKNAMGAERFPSLKTFIGSLIALPHSSATCERVFSELNLIKTKTRNCLNVSTVSGILCAKSMLDNYKSYEFKPSPNLLKKYRKT